jgi:hypothetical protein
LNGEVAELAKYNGIEVRMVSRKQLREFFAHHYDVSTKQKIANTIAYHISALDLYVPPARKVWMAVEKPSTASRSRPRAWEVCSQLR